MKIALFTILAILTGCSSRIVTVPFVIDSTPQGAQVDVDGVNFGVTPATVTYSVTQLWNGLLNTPNWVPAYQISTITVFPPVNGGDALVTQSKTIQPGVTGGRRVFFDLRVAPVQPSQRIDLNLKSR
jgi:hypothetical protein